MTTPICDLAVASLFGTFGTFAALETHHRAMADEHLFRGQIYAPGLILFPLLIAV